MCGRTPSSTPTTNTVSHSSPLAEWMVESTTASRGGLRSDCDSFGDLGLQLFKRRARDGKRADRVDNGVPFGLFSTRRTAWHGITHDPLHVPARRRELTAHGSPDRVELLAQYLATLVGAQPTLAACGVSPSRK